MFTSASTPSAMVGVTVVVGNVRKQGIAVATQLAESGLELAGAGKEPGRDARTCQFQAPFRKPQFVPQLQQGELPTRSCDAGKHKTGEGIQQLKATVNVYATLGGGWQ
jgi:hypothetical protein